MPAYAQHFRCIAIDLSGSGDSDKPPGPYSTETYADQVAAFLDVVGVDDAHVAGVSLGAAVGMHLAARHPGRVRSLSLHSAWDTSDLYLKTVVDVAHARVRTLPDRRGRGHPGNLPAGVHPRDVRTRPEFVDTLTDFVRSRPAQPLDAFLAQTEAAITHDSGPALGEIVAPTLITVGAHDLVCCRFAERLETGIGGSELVIFEHTLARRLRGPRDLTHRATLDFLLRQCS